MKGRSASTLWGVSVIGMTSMPEAKLAREAELPVATLALATDYDCWHEGHDDVTGNTMVCIEAKKRCVVLLSNDVRAEAAFPTLVETLLGPTGFAWQWEYPLPS